MKKITPVFFYSAIRALSNLTVIFRIAIKSAVKNIKIKRSLKSLREGSDSIYPRIRS